MEDYGRIFIPGIWIVDRDCVILLKYSIIEIGSGIDFKLLDLIIGSILKLILELILRLQKLNCF